MAKNDSNKALELARKMAQERRATIEANKRNDTEQKTPSGNNAAGGDLPVNSSTGNKALDLARQMAQERRNRYAGTSTSQNTPTTSRNNEKDKEEYDLSTYESRITSTQKLLDEFYGRYGATGDDIADRLISHYGGRADESGKYLFDSQERLDEYRSAWEELSGLYDSYNADVTGYNDLYNRDYTAKGVKGQIDALNAELKALKERQSIAQKQEIGAMRGHVSSLLNAAREELKVVNPRIKEVQAKLDELSGNYYHFNQQEQMSAMQGNAEAQGQYDTIQGLQADMDKIAVVAADVLYNSGGAEAYEYRKYLEEKYGLTEEALRNYAAGGAGNRPKGEGYTNIMQLYDELSAKQDELKKALKNSGFSYDDTARYEQMLADKQEYEANIKEWQAYAKEHPVEASIGTVLVAPFQGIDYLKQALGNIGHNDISDLENYVPMNVYNMDATNIVSTVRDTVSKEIEANTDWELFDQNVASFLYNTGMSIADSSVQIATFGKASMLFMGMSAASNQAKNVIERGGTNRQALTSGLAAGAAEAIFEKFSIDQLLSTKSVTGWKSFLKETAKQAGVEGSEEMFTEIANILSDAAIMGNKSDYALAVAAYMTEQGMSEEEAKRQAFLDCIGQVGWAGAGGMISGGAMGGPVSLGNYLSNAAVGYTDKNFNKIGGDFQFYAQEMIDTALSLPENSSAYQYATELQKKLASGKTISKTEIGKLAYDSKIALSATQETDPLLEAAREAVGAETTSGDDVQAVSEVFSEDDTQPTQSENAVEAPQNEQQDMVTPEQQTAEPRQVSRKTRTGYGEEGLKLFNEIAENNQIDETELMLRFDAPYQAGLTGLPRNKANLVSDFQLEAYMAGRRDHIARIGKDKKHTPGVVFSESESGFDFVGAPKSITDAQKRFADFFAKKLGVQGYWDGKGGNAKYNAQYNSGTGGVAFAQDFGIDPELMEKLCSEDFMKKVEMLESTRDGSFIFYVAHEIATHVATNRAPEAMRAFNHAMYNYVQGKTGGVTQARHKQASYASKNVALTTEGAIEEVTADSILELYDNDEQKFMEAMYAILNGTDAKAKQGARTLRDMLTDLIKRLKAWASKLTGRENAEARANAEKGISELERLRDMFESAISESARAVEAARKNPKRQTAPAVGEIQNSIKGLSSAAGIDASRDPATGKVTFKIGDKVVTKVTPAHIKNNSGLGGLITTAMDNGFISGEEANIQYKAAADIMNMIINTQDPEMVWAWVGSSMFSAIKSNADGQYGTTVDFTTVCRKTQDMITAMSKAMMTLKRGLTKDEVTKLQAELIAEGSSVPCPVCYVFSRWAGIGSVLDNMYRWQEKYDGFTEAQLNAHIAELTEKLGKGKSKDLAEMLRAQDEEYDSLSFEKEKLALEKKQLASKKKKAVRENDARALVDINNRLAEIDKRNPQINKRLKAIKDSVAPELAWLMQVRAQPDYAEHGKVRPNVLFNLDDAATFAEEFPLAWKYRTSRGPSAGKAILPYSDMRLGDMILGVDKTSADGNTLFAEVTGEFTRDQKSAVEKAIERVKAQNLIGGQRFQSTSDFRYDYALDYLMAFWEAQAIGSKMQTYTKIVEFGDMVAAVGGDFNLSVMPRNKGYITLPNGKNQLIFSSVTGIDFEAAKRSSQMHDNGQLILVGINDQHILAALEDSEETRGAYIGFVIPYHASGASINEFIRVLVSNLGETYMSKSYQDYSDVQSDKERGNATAAQKRRNDLRTKLLKGKDGGKNWEPTAEDLAFIRGESKSIVGRSFEELRAIERKALRGDKAAIAEYESWTAGALWDLYNKMWMEGGAEYGVRLNTNQAKAVMPHEYWNKTVNRDQAYINGFLFRSYCYNLGLTPRFSGAVVKGEKHGDFTDSKGYWKTLIDRPMYNNDGTYRNQQRVNMSKFNMEMLTPDYAKKNWEGYAVQEPDVQRATRAAERFVEQADDTQFSLKGYTADGTEVYETSKEVLKLPWSQRKKLFKDLMSNEYRGRTARFLNERTGEYDYAVFTEDDIGKAIYGNNESDDAGRDAFVNTGADGAVFDLVENAKHDGYSKERGKKTKPHKNVSMWDYYVKTVQIDNAVFDLVINVRQKPSGEFVYSVQLNEDKNKTPAPILVRAYNHQGEMAERESGSRTDVSKPTMPQNGSGVNSQFSLKDSGGRTLSDGQQEYFKDSVVRDKDSNLLVMYHGTSSSGFEVFDTYGGNFGLFGQGSYFTDNRDVAESYQAKGKGSKPGVYEVYLDIKEPLDMDAPADIDKWRKAFRDFDLDESYLDGVKTGEDAFRALKENLADNMYYREEAIETVTDLILSMGYDGITHIGGGRFNKKDDTRHRVYIVFESEQVKDVNNLNPTSDYNIHHSLKGERGMRNEINRIRTEGEKAGKSEAEIESDIMGVVGPEYGELIKTYGEIKRGERPAREIKVPKKSEEDRNVSQTIRTVLEAGATPDAAVPTIEQMIAQGDFSYDVITDKAAMEAAEKRIRTKGYETVLAEWVSDVKDGKVSKANTAIGWALYNQAANAGDLKTAMTILDGMIKHQRNAAQAVQATRILKKMSPDAQLYGVKRSVDNLQEELIAKYGDKAPDLEIDEELARKLLEAETDEARDEAMRDLYRDIGRQMPATFMDKWNAWRYLSMLGNVRTHVRNVVGNAGFMLPVFVKDMTATGIEAAVNFVSGGKLNRTKGMPNRELLKVAYDDYANVATEISAGGKYNDSVAMNQAIEDGRVIFNNKWLEKARKANSAALEMEDVWFSRYHYAFALAQYCKAHGVTADQLRRGKALGNARAYAIKEAQKATYRDANALSEFVSRVGRQNTGDNVVAKGAKVLIEGVLPFRKTPANILARGLEYSPIGMLKSIFWDLAKVKNGEMTGAEMIDNISAGLTGTAILGIGYGLAALGLLRGSGGDDEEEKTFEELQGHQAYALELSDGTSITLDWLAPQSLPMFVGVNLYEMARNNKGNLSMGDILSALTNVTEPMLEMSFLQGINDVLESVGYASSNDLNPIVSILSSAVTSYITQGVPTIFGQGERSAQDVRTTTYADKNNFLTPDMQRTFGKISAKIPGWDFQQIPYIDAWGRTESTGSRAANIANNFLNPAYTSQLETSAMERELERLYTATGEASVLPSRADKYFNVDKERKDLTAKEYVKYATEKGQLSYKVVTALTKSAEYKSMTDFERVEAIDLAYDYANAVAKTKVSKYAPEGWIAKAIATNKKTGLSPEKYIPLYMAQKDIESLRDADGDPISNSSGLQIMQMVYSTDGLTSEQKQALFSDFGVGKTIIHYSPALVNQKLKKMHNQ